MARIWTEAQKQAIDARKGTVLVSAAAGSGKTAVLVERVIKIITDESNPVDVEKLLVVTYTKAAAAEMKERISARLSELIQEQPLNRYLKRQKMYLPNARISTMDSFCGKLVKENFDKAGVIPDFKMLSEVEHNIMKREVINQVLEDLYNLPQEETEAFLSLFTNGKNDENLISSILSMYDFAMASQNPVQWIEKSFAEYFDDKLPCETEWGKFCLNRIAEILEYVKIKAADILEDAPEGTSLFGALNNDITPLIASVDDVLEKIYHSPEKWDEIRNDIDLLKFSNFPRIPKDEKDDCYEELKARRDSIKKYLSFAQSVIVCSEKEFYEDICYLRPVVLVLKKCILEFMTLLDNRKKEKGTYYFSDIIHIALKLLIDFKEDGSYEKTPLANELSENFEEILIDEFQDTNEAQDTLFSVLSKDNTNKFMVGDVKQSIYRFRQAMPEIFMNYKESFSVFDGKNYPATINLDKNFRSRDGIVEGINFFFDFLMTKKSCGIDYKKGEQLVFGGNYDTSDKADVSVHIVETDVTRKTDLVAEAHHIGNIIKELVESGELIGKKGEEHPVRYSDICILLRAVKDQAAVVAKELIGMGIPAYFQKKSGFFESREIVTMFSMLKVIDNPVQDIPLVSVMLSPMFPFTEDDLAVYRSKMRKGSFYSVIKNQYGTDKKVKDFLDLLTSLRALSVTMDVGSLIRRVLEITSYDSIAGAMDNGEKRILNLERLINYAENYEANGGSGLTGFIRYLDKIRNNNNDLEGASDISENDDVVRIMSIHKSKGLEFPIVFLANCCYSFTGKERNKVKINRNLGPGIPRLINELNKDFPTLPLNSVKLCEARENTAELIRLLYVAMTRAEEKLYLVGSLNNTEKKILDLYYDYYGSFTDCSVPLSMCNSFMQWILLAMMNHPSMNFTGMINCPKNYKSTHINFGIFEKNLSVAETDKKTKNYQSDKDLLEIIKEKASYRYPYAELSGISVKYAASSMDREIQLDYITAENPAFAGAGELTPSQRGTVNHKFMEICDFAASGENLDAEIQRLTDVGKLTSHEAEAINRTAVRKFFSSALYSRIIGSEKFIREQEFTMELPISRIIGSFSDSEHESVIVQGVMDGLIVNGKNGEIVDYKTDRVSSAEELCERYKEQMKIYKMAAEECFGLENVTVSLYSFHLSEEISLKL